MEKVIEKLAEGRPGDTIIVSDNDKQSNNGLAVAIILIIAIILLIIFGRGLFGGRDTDTNVQAPTGSQSGQ